MLHHDLCSVLAALLLFVPFAVCAPPRSNPVRFPPVQLDATANGLYSATDDVISITADSFRSYVFEQDQATVVEFYNAYCGFCQRFAPHWKRFASDVRAWRGVAQVTAVDCANDANSQLCREYEIMSYPTLRFFGPHFNEPKNYGVPLKHSDAVPTLRRSLAASLRNVSAALIPAHWPQRLNASDRPLSALFDGAAERVKLAFVLYEPSDSWLATELALDFYANRQVLVERVQSAAVAETYGLHRPHTVAIVNRQLEAVPLTLLNETFSRDVLRTTVQRFIRDHDLAPAPTSAKPTASAAPPSLATQTLSDSVAYVKTHEPTVYLADIEKTVWYALGHEVPQYADISGDRLDALKRFVRLLHQYVPLTANGPSFFVDLQSFLDELPGDLRGEQFSQQIVQLKHKWHLTNVTDPATMQWVACQSSVPNRRGYTCGLWTLFHFLTIQADYETRTQTSTVNPTDALAVLRTVHDYVKHFFGCSECSGHFQAMAVARKLWDVPSRREAVLWLWRAHNEVNARLAGDATEDPVFPKVQYPGPKACGRCRDSTAAADGWRTDDVLQHLREVYAAANLSWHGLPVGNRPDGNETTAPAAANAPQSLVAERRVMDGVFSDLDMRMGILLYVFCIGMILVAVKLFMRRRGYRKKLYTHDFFGKV